MQVDLKNKAEKDILRLVRRGKDIGKFEDVIDRIITKTLEPRHRDHALIGDWKGWRDCHVENDWVLIYQIVKDTLISPERERIQTCSKINRVFGSHLCELVKEPA